MAFRNLGLYPDSTRQEDDQIGAFDETQVLVKGVHPMTLRGNRQGMKEAYAYTSRQFLSFKPTLIRNVIESLGWLFTPSVVMHGCLGLYAMGFSPVVLGLVVGLLFLLFIGLISYALVMSPSLSTPVAIRLAFVLIAVLVL